jgi:hypothetical protein
MGYIRERNLKNGGIRYQAEIRLNGHPTRTAVFDRKTNAKTGSKKRKQTFAVEDSKRIHQEKSVLSKKLLIATLKNNLFRL